MLTSKKPRRSFATAFALIATSTLLVSLPEISKAHGDDALQAECTKIAERLLRLKCFDKAHNTPGIIDEIGAGAGPEDIPARQEERANQSPFADQNFARAADEPVPGLRWRFGYSPWESSRVFDFDHYRTQRIRSQRLPQPAPPPSEAELLDSSPEKVAVLDQRPNTLLERLPGIIIDRHFDAALTLPARPLEDQRQQAVLAITCVNDITSVSLSFEEPIVRKSGQYQFRATGEELKTGEFRRIEPRTMLLAPRGLAGITFLTELIGKPSLSIIIDELEYSTTHTFSIAGLGEVIRPLGRACHWDGGYIEVGTSLESKVENATN